LRKAIANHDVELARIGMSRFRAALAARVRTLGFDLFAADEKASAAREVAERFQALREVLVQRDPAGLTPVLETRVIEATALTLQRRASDALLRSRSALLELNQLTARPLDTTMGVTVPEMVFRPAAAAQDLLASAETNNFDLRLRQVELAQQGFRLDLARNQRYPAVTVGPMFTEERSGDRDRIFAVGLSVPLPLWNRGSDNIEAARARQGQAETLLLVAQRDIQRRVLDASQRYEARLAEMGRWRPDSIAHFRDAAELADRHYRLGAVPVSVYVELQKQYLEAVESLLDTRRDALEAAQSLESLTGWPRPLFGPEGRP
jgi:cobalt-zinc-cadmium efflux system outer membrane protein